MPALHPGRWLFVGVLLSAGCEGRSTLPSPVPAEDPHRRPTMAYDPLDAGKLDAADVSLLFIGNSHTRSCDLPDLIADMIEFRQPEKSVYVHLRNVGFLEEVVGDFTYAQALDAGRWTAVVLQGQRISASGKFEYSLEEGIAFAERVKAAGAEAVFYAEWGLRGVDGDGRRVEGIYRRMADASGATVAPVGRAWDLALAERPGLPLYAADGNHQSDMGAFLTACVLYGVLTGVDPAGLGSFPYRDYAEADRRFLADTASKVTHPKEDAAEP